MRAPKREPVGLTSEERLTAAIVLTWAAEQLEANAGDLEQDVVEGGALSIDEDAAMVAGLREQAAMSRHVARLLGRGLG